MLANKVLVLSSVLLFAFVGQTLAYTTEESLQYISRILKRLNNDHKCQLPTYEEIDALQKSFEQLDEIEFVYSFDQELVRETILHQWTSFQKYLVEKYVTPGAKRRSFVGRVIRYQLRKYGSSVCENERDGRNPQAEEEDDDEEFIDNPLVRYAKELKREGRYRGGSSSFVDFKSVKKNSGGVKPTATTTSVGVTDDAPKSVVEKQANNEALEGPYRGRITYSSNLQPKKITVNIHHK